MSLEPALKTKLTSALVEFVQRKAQPNDSLVCTVKEVDTVNYVCYCEPIGDYADVQQVKVRLEADKQGFYLVPKLESLVVVTFTSSESAFISMVSEIDNLVIYIDTNNKLEVSSTGFIFNGGTLDGLVKVNDLVTKLNNLENLINKFVTNVNAWVPVPNDGGAALKALFTGNPVVALTPTVRANIENTKIKQ